MSFRLIQSPLYALLISLFSAVPLALWGLLTGDRSLFDWIELLLATLFFGDVLAAPLPEDPKRRERLLMRTAFTSAVIASMVVVTVLPAGIEWEAMCQIWLAAIAGMLLPLRIAKWLGKDSNQSLH